MEASLRAAATVELSTTLTSAQGGLSIPPALARKMAGVAVDSLGVMDSEALKRSHVSVLDGLRRADP